MRILAFGLWAAVALSGCTTAPGIVREGDLSALKGQGLASLEGHSAGTDGALAAAIQAGVLKRLAANGAEVSGGKPPAYLLQVGVGVSAPAVGVSDVAGPSFKDTAWRSAPTKRHFWRRRGPAQTATAVVLDVTTGKPAAWATVRADGADAETTADRLVRALVAPAP